MFQSPKTKTKARTIATQEQLAKELDRDASQISRYVRDPRWTFGKGPWRADQVPAMLDWMANMLRDQPVTDADPQMRELRRLKIATEVRKLQAQASAAETALAKERGALHDADECETETVRRAVLFKNAVQNIPLNVVSLSLSHGLPHQSAPALQKDVEHLVNAALRHLAQQAGADDAVSGGGSPVSAAVPVKCSAAIGTVCPDARQEDPRP